MHTESESSMYQILKLKNEINNLVSDIEDIYFVFDDVSLEIPAFLHPEIGFLRVTSWMYVLYFESGKVNIDFLCELFEAYNIDETKEKQLHLTYIHDLRTFLQHNLNYEHEHDITINKNCKLWFRNNCKTSAPSTKEQWENCLKSILNESIEFLKSLRSCIQNIEIDDSYEQIISQWVFRRKQYHPPHEFERIIELTANDMGRENINAKKLCNKYINDWRKELELLKVDYDFDFEVRRRVENVLMNDVQLIVTGKDIIECGIQPGPEIEKYLKKAELIYKNSEQRHSKEELLNIIFG